METSLRNPSRLQLQRWGGAAFMLGNVLFLVNKLNEMSRLFFSRWMADVISGQDPGLIITGQIALIIGYIAFFQLYSAGVSRLGKIALWLFCGGGILVALSHVGFISNLRIPGVSFDLFFIVLIGLPLMLTGLILFGIANLRQPVMGRWQWLPLATGVMGFIGFFFFSGEQITAIFLLLRTLFATGLVGLGLVMWLERPAKA